MIADYSLADLGFHFENGTVEDCTGAALDAVGKDELVGVPLWHPQWLHQELDLRELDDPMGLLGGQDEATLVLRRDAMGSHRSSEVSGRALVRQNPFKVGCADKMELESLRSICVPRR